MVVCFQVLLQWTHLQWISFAIAPVVLLIVLPLKKHVGEAITHESTVLQGVSVKVCQVGAPSS